jgi:hypothetical protein
MSCKPLRNSALLALRVKQGLHRWPNGSTHYKSRRGLSLRKAIPRHHDDKLVWLMAMLTVSCDITLLLYCSVVTLGFSQDGYSIISYRSTPTDSMCMFAKLDRTYRSLPSDPRLCCFELLVHRLHLNRPSTLVRTLVWLRSSDSILFFADRPAILLPCCRLTQPRCFKTSHCDQVLSLPTASTTVW